ncbi:MAG: hypothetical protein JWO05_2748 [Gemmatimonadetes bacterium]|nr:hypothetical protein [Gemmatimonadota bacterium]
MMRIAILEPFSGISGDMTLGALLDLGLDPEWLKGLPALLELEGVSVQVSDVLRAGIACRKVDFEIPPQPHGRHLRHLRAMIAKAAVPERVRERADRAFTLIAEQEATIHGTTVEKVHLHEVGAVDAILDVVGSIWGFEQLGVERIFCGAMQVGEGFVTAAHGVMPVPAPATLRILEGIRIRPGPVGSGELVTPTGAALVRVLSEGPPPREYTPLRSGYGAGTRTFEDRANALRITLADLDTAATVSEREQLVHLACDVDDMSPEYLAQLAETMRSRGALDVTLLPVTMKKGRPGVRIEVLAGPSLADYLETLLLQEGSSIGVRRTAVERRALDRRMATVEVLGHSIAVKVVTLPDGSTRAKPEFEDVQRASLATGHAARDIFLRASAEAERA